MINNEYMDELSLMYISTSNTLFSMLQDRIPNIRKRNKTIILRSLLEAGGVDRLMNVTRQRAKYTSRYL